MRLASDFSLQGVGLRVISPGGSVAERVEAVLRHFGARDLGSVDVAVVLDLCAAAPPELVGAPRTTGSHLDVTVLRDAEGLVLRAEHAVSRLTPEGRSSHTWLSGGPEAQIPLHVFAYLLFNHLRLLGLYTLHAGCVTWDGAGFLLVGASGSGKSTLTLGLLHCGWDILSDDSVLLRTRADGVEVLALRRGVFLEPAAAEVFPDYRAAWRPCPLVEASKQQLAVDELFVGRQVEQCAPRAIVLPVVDASVDTVALEPLSQEAALFELARQSRLAELDSDGIPAQLALIGQLASTVPAWRLRLGPAARARPTLASDALRGLLGAREAA